MDEIRIDCRIPPEARLEPPRPCAKIGCPTAADWQMGIRLTRGGPADALLADHWLLAAVCDGHKAGVTIDILLPPARRQDYLEWLEDRGFDVPGEVGAYPMFVVLVAGSA